MTVHGCVGSEGGREEAGIERAEEGVRGRAVKEEAEGARRVAFRDSGWSKESCAGDAERGAKTDASEEGSVESAVELDGRGGRSDG